MEAKERVPCRGKLDSTVIRSAQLEARTSQLLSLASEVRMQSGVHVLFREAMTRLAIWNCDLLLVSM